MDQLTLARFGLDAAGDFRPAGFDTLADANKFLAPIDDVKLQNLATVGEFLKFKGVLQVLGPAATLLQGAIAIHDASEAYAAGDEQRAVDLLGGGIGNIIGGEFGALGGAALATGLALSGPMGWVAGAVLVLGGAYAGSELGEYIGTRTDNLLRGDLSFLHEDIGALKDWISSAGDAAGRFIDGAVNQIERLAQNVGEFGVAALQQAVSDVRDLISDAGRVGEEMVRDISNLADGVMKGLEHAGEEFSSLAHSIVEGLGNFLDGALNLLGLGKTTLTSPDDKSGFTGIWCCVTVDQDGRWVAYESSDSKITPDDSNGFSDIFIYQVKDYFYPVGSIQRISIGYNGQQGNGDSFNPVLSPDGDSIAFTSYATNLVTGDTNGVTDVFVGSIDILPQRVSVSSNGQQGNGASYFAAVSDQAREVAFVSEATNLVANDTNGVSDIFLRDRTVNKTSIISTGVGGAQANGASTMPTISADGMLVSFVSTASNLVAGDTNGKRDIFVYDRSSKTMERISETATGVGGNGDSWAPVMTRDGRFVAFFSAASNLVGDDSNGKNDVFVYDRQTGAIERVSLGLAGAETNGDSGGQPVSGPLPGNAWGLAISDDGRYVSFISEASNLVSGDTNGQSDVFLVDRVTGSTVRINQRGATEASGGPLGSNYAGAVAMSGDASLIAYISDATNLTPEDKNTAADVFFFQAQDRIAPTLGTAASEFMAGTAEREMLGGLSGADTLDGREGDDMLFGGGDRDVLLGGTGDDVLDGGTGNDRMLGGAGSDRYYVNSLDDIVFEGDNQGTTDEVVTALDGYRLARNVEKLVLTGSDDLTAKGNGGNNLIFGNAGANMITGGSGNDIIDGGAGDDEIYGQGGNDRISGFEGDDLLYGGTGADTLEGGIGADHLFGGDDSDKLFGQDGDDILEGGDGADTLDGGLGVDQMDGGAGNDIYIVDDLVDSIVERLSGGIDTVRSSVTLTLAKYLENLVLLNDALNGTGNSANNEITGNDLANRLDGMAGNDTLIGGKGDDEYIIDSSLDLITEKSGGGVDTIYTSASFVVSLNVENLEMLGVADINATGNNLDNVIRGNDGDNRIDGKSGSDTMAGGLGSDVYIVDALADIVVEEESAGFDRVQAFVSYTLGNNIEDLVLTGKALTGTGNNLGNAITGTSGDNTLSGLAGNDIISGLGGIDTILGGDGDDSLDGGTGSDTMDGGLGNDDYFVDNVGDIVVEAASGGIDHVTSTISYSLSINLEHLTLTGTSSVSATGNAANNIIVGNAGNNIIDGKAGNDNMSGASGDDTYFVDRLGDTVTELVNSGRDTVKSSVSYVLGDNLENLELLGSLSLAGTGNNLDNMIIGTNKGNVIAGRDGSDELFGLKGNDKLDGGAGNDLLDGGEGADQMVGGDGNDTYVVDRAGDILTEYLGGGIDTVRSSVNIVLVKYFEESGSAGDSAQWCWQCSSEQDHGERAQQQARWSGWQ